MSDPRYSILLTSRNEGASVRRTVDDLIRRGPAAPFELVIVDDASEDGSLEFLAEPAYRALPIRTARNPERRGLIYGRALSARLARGTYLVFLDAHCAVKGGWLEALEEDLESVGSRGIVSSQMYHLDPESWTPDESGLPIRASTIVSPSLEFGWTDPVEVDGKECTCTIPGCGWMVRKDWYDHIGRLDEEMVFWGGENIDIPLRSWVAGGWCLVSRKAVIGHHFLKDTPSNPTAGETIVYNKLRAAHNVFERPTFERVLAALSRESGFTGALRRIHEHRDDIARLKGYVEGIRKRPDRWLIETFELPILEAPAYHEAPWRRSGDDGWRRRRVSALVPWMEESRSPDATVASILDATTFGKYGVVLCAGGTTGAKLPEVVRDRRRVRLLGCSEPAGWPALVNLGAAGTDAAFVAVVDDRAAIVDPEWIEKFLLLFERHPGLVMASPRLVAPGGAGETGGDLFDLVWSRGAPGLLVERRGSPLAPRPYRALSCPEGLLFLRRAAFLSLGGFDRAIEDRRTAVLDFAVRAWLCGHEVFCHPGIAVEWRRPEERGGQGESPAGLCSDPASLVAVKYFRSRSRREAALAWLQASRLLEEQIRALDEGRRQFLKQARFDEDWLFFRFGIEDGSHHG